MYTIKRDPQDFLNSVVFLHPSDFKNVSIVAHYIKERTRNAQFVIISLRNNMFELADRLVGIYKTNNATKSVAINPANFVVGAPAAAAAPALPVPTAA